MTEKLKPCPFCGGEAELCYGPGLGTASCRGYTLRASCKECGATSPGLWQEKKPEPDDKLWAGAADDWNHRPGEAAETCGKAYCEHYPEGLPVCAKCREASTLAHDRACAELAEARAEIESYRLEHDQMREALETFMDSCADKDRQLAEARADADHWKSECNALQYMAHEARAEIEGLRLMATNGNPEPARRLMNTIKEQRAEIERLNKDLGNALDTVLAMLLVARGGECDIDTLHAEMNKVSKKPSEYIKHILKERDALIEQMREALEKVIYYTAQDYYREDEEHVRRANKVAKAALAAERGE
jgi:hypothetical protein